MVKKSSVTEPTDGILARAMVMVPVGDLVKYPKNPRVGNIAAIKESIQTNGFFRPLIVQRSTMYVIGGNHSLQAARELGYTEVPVVFLDVDDVRAAKIVLADNRTNDLATYDTQILEEVLKYVQTPIGTGYSQADMDALVEAIEYHDTQVVQDVIRPDLSVVLDDSGGRTASIVNPVMIGPATAAAEREQGKLERDEEEGTLDTVDAKLQGILQLSEDREFASTNYYGIPDLAVNGLLDKLPEKIDTWGGYEATPDDGVTTWVWNYGVASRKNLPGDRAILCFYTHDHYFEAWWDAPAFYTAKVINMGIKAVVVPDFSFYDEFPTALHIYNTFRAQWLGRFFQEAGLKVIPRLQFSTGDGGKSLDFCMAGIPQNPPILASSIQNVIDKEGFKNSVNCLKKGLETIRPTQWLVYGGNPAVRHIEALDPVAKGLCDEVVHIYNYAHKRRGTVYDKKEGLAGVKKEAKRRDKDPLYDGNDDDLRPPDEEPQTTASKRSRKRRSEPVQEVDDATFDE